MADGGLAERERNEDGLINSEIGPVIAVERATWVNMWPGMGRLNLGFGEVERFQACQARAWWLGLTTGRRRQEATEKPGCLAGAQLPQLLG